MKNRFDQQEKKLNKFMEERRETQQRLASLEQDARQPRLAIEADVPSDTKTYERTEGAAAAVQAKHGHSCSVKSVQAGRQVLPASVMTPSTGPLALPCSRDDALVDNSTAAPKSCLSPLEVRIPTVAGGLLPAGKASLTTKITYHSPHLRFYPTEKTNSEKTLIIHA